MKYRAKMLRIRLDIFRCKLCLIWNRAILRILLAVRLIVFGKDGGVIDGSDRTR